MQCALLYSTGSSNSITSEFTCEVYYLADSTGKILPQVKIIQRKLLCGCELWVISDNDFSVNFVEQHGTGTRKRNNCAGVACGDVTGIYKKEMSARQRGHC